MTRIIVTRRMGDYRAHVAGKPHLWDRGETPGAAIGALVLRPPPRGVRDRPRREDDPRLSRPRDGRRESAPNPALTGIYHQAIASEYR